MRMQYRTLIADFSGDLEMANRNENDKRRRLFRLTGWLAAAAVVLTLFLLPVMTVSAYRPGGGHTYSGGSSGSSGGGFSGGGSYSGSGSYSGAGGGFLGVGSLTGCGLPKWSEYIIIGLFLVGFIFSSVLPKLTNSDENWASGGNVAWGAPPPPPPPDLSGLRQHDPNFSSIVLEDFLSNLYMRTMESRGTSRADVTGGLKALAPYLSKEVRATIANRGNRPVQEVTGVVVGSQKVTSLAGLGSETVTINVEFESNYTEIYPATPGGKPPQPMGFYARERWILSRSANAKSRKPAETQTFNCPNCGAPVETSQDEKCAYCGSFFNSGEFDWFVTSVVVLSEEPRGPLLTGHVEEKGTNLPTIFHPDREKALGEIKERDQGFDLNGFEERVKKVYHEMYDAWTNLTWEKARPYVTDRFFMGQTYWIQAYQKQGLRNVLQNFRTTRMEFVKAISDPFFDAITLRIFATGFEYTIHAASGRIVSGNNKKERPYSEYWTMVRARKDTNEVANFCPACGAPLDVNSSGNCDHCGSKVATGASDWVLSRIEQDESYAG